MKFKKFGGTEQKVYDLIKPITDELGYYLWDVCYEKEGAMWYLRVFIDQDEGITIADCERANAPISDILDEKDPIAQSYMLEVGSAGLERELVKEEHFEVCQGDTVMYAESIDFSSCSFYNSKQISLSMIQGKRRLTVGNENKITCK